MSEGVTPMRPGGNAAGRAATAAILALAVGVRLAAIFVSSPQAGLSERSPGADRATSGWVDGLRRTIARLNLHAWPADHGAYVQWARHADQHGVLSLYTLPPDPAMRVYLSNGEQWVYDAGSNPANYPPLALFLVAVEGRALRAWETSHPAAATIEGAAHDGKPGHSHDASSPPTFVANTIAARFAFQTLGLIFDLLVAWGAAALAAHVASRRAGAVAGAVVLLAPPMWLDSCWWGQTESWLLAPALWMTVQLVRGRYLRAGVWWGVALGIKTQALLLAPVWVMAWWLAWRGGGDICSDAVDATPADRDGVRTVDPIHSHDHRPRAGRVVAGFFLGLVVLNLIALPFWLESGAAWIRESIVRNLRDEAPHTTLKAFNVWYIDLLLTLDTSVKETIGPLTKDLWGRGLLLLGFASSWIVARRAPLTHATRMALFAALWLLAAVMLPTRVHERYLVLALPFAVAAACAQRRLWPGVIGLMIVATAQVTVYRWLDVSADAWSRVLQADTRQHYQEAIEQTPPEFRDKLPATVEDALRLRWPHFVAAHAPYAPWEWAFTLLALTSYGWVLIRAARLRVSMSWSDAAPRGP